MRHDWGLAASPLVRAILIVGRELLLSVELESVIVPGS